MKEMNRLCLALLLSVATASAASNGGPEVPAIPVVTEVDHPELVKNSFPMKTVPESRNNLILGSVGADDRMIARFNHVSRGSSFLIPDQDVTFRGVKYTNITAIKVVDLEPSQDARPTIQAGGLGHDYVTIRILGTYRGQAYDFLVEIYGAINCSNS